VASVSKPVNHAPNPDRKEGAETTAGDTGEVRARLAAPRLDPCYRAHPKGTSCPTGDMFSRRTRRQTR